LARFVQRIGIGHEWPADARPRGRPINFKLEISSLKLSVPDAILLLEGEEA
jgi:hypothetical protein